MTVDERARAGLFLAMQYPVEVPGVSVAQFGDHVLHGPRTVDAERPQIREPSYQPVRHDVHQHEPHFGVATDPCDDGPFDGHLHHTRANLAIFKRQF